MSEYLYATLLRLYPRQMRDQFAGEMLEVYSAAAKDALASGMLNYFRFCIREVFGLLWDLTGAVRINLSRRFFMTRFRWMFSGCLAGLLVAGLTIGFRSGNTFQSNAKIQIMEPSNDQWIPISTISLPALLQRMNGQLLGRHALNTLVQKFSLYQAELKRIPAEEILENMRRNITIRPSGDNGIWISFVYSSPELAQKVTQEMAYQIIEEESNFRVSESNTRVSFLKEEVENSARQWAEAESAINSQQTSRTRLDIDLARDQYKSAKEKLYSAQRAQTIALKKLEPTLKLTDAATYPQTSLQKTDGGILLSGLGGGALFGLVFGLLLSFAARAPQPSPSEGPA